MWNREPTAEQRGGSCSDGIFFPSFGSYLFVCTVIEKAGQGGWPSEALGRKAAQCRGGIDIFIIHSLPPEDRRCEERCEGNDFATRFC